MHAAISGPWARAKHVTTTKPAVSYVLSRLSAQASYHHLSTRLGLKVIPRQWTPEISTTQQASMLEHPQQ